MDAEVKAAFDVAYDNIRQFHQAQKDKDTELRVETMPGVVCRRVSRPIGASYNMEMSNRTIRVWQGRQKRP